MNIVKLGTHPSGLLFVNASVVRSSVGPPKVCDIPFNFVADTASERSFICKYHQTIMERALGLRSGHQVVHAKTLWGEMKYTSSRGYALRFLCLDGSEITVNSAEKELCFADDSLKAKVGGDQSKPAELPDPINYFSIIGRDILREFNLFIPAGMARGGALVKDNPVNTPNHWAELCQALENPALPIPYAERTGDVNWDDTARYLRRHK